MSEQQEIRRKLDALQKGLVQHLPVKVKKVETETCTVEYEGLEVYDVLLRAAKNGKSTKYLIKPTVGSDVMISRVLHSKRFYVDMFSEIDEVEILAKKGVSIKTEKASLLDVIAELIQEMQNAIITTPAGAGSVSPTTISKLKVIENKLKQVLK